jgi:hypothetical protein
MPWTVWGCYLSLKKMLGPRLPPRTKNRMAVLHLSRASSSSPNQRRTDRYGSIGRAPYLKSGDGAEGRPGRVEEERRWLGGWTTGGGGLPRAGRQAKAPGKGRMAAGAGFGSTGNSATLGSDSGWIGEGELRWRAGVLDTLGR